MVKYIQFSTIFSFSLPNEVLALDHGGDPIVVDIRVFLSNDFIDDYAISARTWIKSLTRHYVVFSMHGMKKIILKENVEEAMETKSQIHIHTDGVFFSYRGYCDYYDNGWTALLVH